MSLLEFPVPSVLNLKPLDISLLALGAWLLYKVGQTMRPTVKTTVLKGPRSRNWFIGVTRKLMSAEDGGLTIENWMKEYGPVYQVDGLLGSKRVIICDPKAINYFYSLETKDGSPRN